MFNRVQTQKRLDNLEKAIKRLEKAQCCTGCTITVNWDYSGEDLSDSPQFIITVNSVEEVNATSCIFPSCPDPQSGSFTVQEGDIVELTVGNAGGFHIYEYTITGSIDGVISSGGNFSGYDNVPFTATCQTYTITATQ